MAICHYKAGHIKRSTGRSAVQNAAYITGTNLHEERRDQPARYGYKAKEVSFAKTYAPEWAGEDFHNTEKAWNAFENYEDEYAMLRYKKPETQEKHKQTAQTGMTVVAALPRELSPEIQKELMEDFIKNNFVSKGHVVTLGIHQDEGNPHAHLLISHRPIKEDGTISYTKNRAMCSRLGLKEQRKNWADMVNHYLEREGLDVRIDHRSYKDQGLDLIPTTHEGWHARKLEDQGIESRICADNRAIREENQQRISQYPEIIFKELNAQKATFSELDVIKVVQNRTLDHPHLAQHAFESVMEKAIHVGHGFNRQMRFTSPEYHAKEQELLANIEKLSATSVVRKIEPLAIQSCLNHFRFLGKEISDEQEQAVNTLCANSAFSVLVGRAGTGKTSSVLKPVVALHQEAGFRVVGMALAAEAAKNLANETGCKADTIAYYTYRWNEIPKLKESLKNPHLPDKDRFKDEAKLEEYQKTIPTKDTVIIVDEAGMVGTEDWYQLASMAAKTGAKLIVCGDDHQYKAINAGDVLRHAIDVAAANNCKAELSFIFRQTEDWMKEASMKLSQLETTAALMAYENRGNTRELETQEKMIHAIASQYLVKVTENPNETGIILTSTNAVRLALNKEIRQNLQRHGLLEKDAFTHQGKGFAIGEKIIFLENDRAQFKVQSESCQFAVTNGTRGTIEAVESVLVESKKESKTGEVTHEKVTTQQITVRVSDTDRVKYTLNEYQGFDHAYAMTGHKSQGQTLDWSIVHLSKNMDAYALYVGLTRHRGDVTLYHNKEEVESFSKFADNIRVGYKDLVIDYSINPENYEYYFNVEDYKALGREIMQGIKAGENVDDLLKERKETAQIILEEKDEHKLFVMQAGLTFERLEITAGLKARPLTLIEQKAQTTVEQYALVAFEARDLWRKIRRTAPGVAAKNHPEYQRFESLRQERGSLANMIMDAPVLHRPFLKEVTKDLGYGLATIQKQAEAFQSSQLQQALKASGLDRDTAKQLEVLSAYVETRDQFGQLWKDLKPQLQAAEGTLLKATLNDQVELVRHTSIQRDKLAYQIADNLESYQSLAKSIQVTLDLPKIFDQTENGLRQACIEQYQHSDSQLAKSMAAYELNQLWNLEKAADIKTTVRELLHNNINLLELKATAHQFERTQVYACLETEKEKGLFKSLEHYQDLKQTANDHYKICLEDAKEKEIKPWESAYYPAFHEISVARDTAAHKLIKEPYPEVSTLAEKMSVSLKTIDLEAHRDYLRQTSETYLSGMGGKSVYAAKELQAWLDFDREAGSNHTVAIMAEMKYLPREVIQHLKEAETKALNKTIEKRNLENHISPSASYQPRNFDKHPPIHESLKDRMPELAQELLGNPSSRTGIQWRFGRKGSIAIMVNGSQKGLYSNFETGTHGGPMKLIEEQLKLSPQEATAWAKDWLGQTHDKTIIPQQAQKEVKEATWTPILPVPTYAVRPDIQNNPYLSYMLKDRETKSIYEYKNEQGQTLGYVVRLEDKDGCKITPTLTYCQNEQGQQHWRWKGFEGQRPLYGLDRLDKDKPVLIVEGEKSADAAQKLLPEYAVLSWHGGAGAVAKADWSPLVGRDVTIWPDNDAPGFKAATKITKTLKQLHAGQNIKAQIKTVDLPKDLPEKWDLADHFPETLTIDKIKSFIEASPASVQKPEQDLSWKEALEQMMRAQKENRIRQATGKSLEEYEQVRNEFYQTFEKPNLVSSETPQNRPSWREALESLRPGSNFKEAHNQLPHEKLGNPIEDSIPSPSTPHFKSQIEVSADLFIKNYKEYVIADKEDRTTLSQKEEFKQKIKTISKDQNLMAAIKERNLEVGKEVEALAKSYEKQHEQQRGFHISR